MSAQWSVDWEGWGELLVDVAKLRRRGGEVMAAEVLETGSATTEVHIGSTYHGVIVDSSKPGK